MTDDEKTGTEAATPTGNDAELEASLATVQTKPVGEPMQYTGSGTPDIAVSYTPGVDDSEDWTAGDESNAVGSPEQRDTLAGVNN